MRTGTVACGNESTWSHCVKGRLLQRKEEVERSLGTVVDGGRANDGWGIGSAGGGGCGCGGGRGCLHPCRRRRKRRRRVVMLVWAVVVVVGHERGIGRVCGLTSGM